MNVWVLMFAGFEFRFCLSLWLFDLVCDFLLGFGCWQFGLLVDSGSCFRGFDELSGGFVYLISLNVWVYC